jgi:TonB family protein
MKIDRRVLTSWGFSLATHAILLLSAGLLITDVWVILPHPETSTLNVTLSSSHPQQLPQTSNLVATKSTTKNTIAYTPNKHSQTQSTADTALRHRTLSETNFEPRDADYLTAWRQLIEAKGTQAYKTALLKNPQLHGQLSMRVSIDATGKLKHVMIEKSSGSVTLDKLALNIVKNAAPFKPLPDAMKKDTDVLDILRTWEFNVSGTHPR